MSDKPSEVRWAEKRLGRELVAQPNGRFRITDAELHKLTKRSPFRPLYAMIAGFVAAQALIFALRYFFA